MQFVISLTDIISIIINVNEDAILELQWLYDLSISWLKENLSATICGWVKEHNFELREIVMEFFHLFFTIFWHFRYWREEENK